MKHKLLALLLCAVMALGLAACSADDLETALLITDAVLDMTGDGEAGVIGGADGPTTIFVTDGENTTTTTVPEDTKEPAPQQSAPTTENTTPQAPTGYDEPAVEVLPIDEDGTYNSVEDVSLYLYTYGDLPDNYITKNDARSLGWEGGSVEDYAGEGYAIGGDKFGNKEGVLPKISGRQYYECDIDTVGRSKRGAKRIVWSNDGLIYYTGDHYEHFDLLYGPTCQENHYHEDDCYENHHEHHENHHH